jgi:hypothetical protein
MNTLKIYISVTECMIKFTCQTHLILIPSIYYVPEYSYDEPYKISYGNLVLDYWILNEYNLIKSLIQ